MLGSRNTMPSYFHFNRIYNHLYHCCQLLLRRVEPEWDSDADELNSRFPRGLSHFGLACLCRNTRPKPEIVVYREWLLEEIRRRHYSHRPSRLESLFACRTAEEAVAMQREMKCEGTALWEVGCESAFICDMYFTNITPRSLDTLSRRAKEEWEGNLHSYWRGEASENPLWECLLPLPVVVIRRHGDFLVDNETARIGHTPG
jgi:hypothetical protein